MYMSVCITQIKIDHYTATAPGPVPLPVTAASPITFSDALSPTDLVTWLSQQFQAKELTLDPSLGWKLIGK